MIRLWVWVLVLAASGHAQELAEERRAGSDTDSAPERLAQLSRQQTVAPSGPEAPEAARKRARAQQGLVILLILTLVLVGLFLVLMVLAARWTRYHFVGRERRKRTALQDLWWQVKDEALPQVDIEHLMSEDQGEQKRPPDGGAKKGEDG